MTVEYIIWLEMQQADDCNADYDMLADEAIELARFVTREEAREFAQHADELLSGHPDAVTKLLASRREIAVVWCVDDVLEMRPELTREQAWEVLESVKHHHNADIGIHWEVLRSTANELFEPPGEQ